MGTWPAHVTGLWDLVTSAQRLVLSVVRPFMQPILVFLVGRYTTSGQTRGWSFGSKVVSASLQIWLARGFRLLSGIVVIVLQHSNGNGLVVLREMGALSMTSQTALGPRTGMEYLHLEA